MFFCKKINVWDYFLGLLILAVCTPDGLIFKFPETKYIFVLAKIISAICILYVVMAKKKIQVYWFWWIYWGYNIFNTIMHFGNVKQLLTVIFIEMLAIYGFIVAKKMCANLNMVCYRICSLYVFMNFISMLIFSEGVGKTRVGKKIFFATTANGLSYLIVVYTFLLVILLREKKIKKETFFYSIVICAFELVMAESGTAIIVYLIYLSLLFFASRIDYVRYKNMLFGVLLVLNAFCLMQGQFKVFINFFNLIGEDITMSGRTTIWLLGIEKWYENMLLGYGYQTNGYFIQYKNIICEGHNLILQMLLQGGVLLLILVLFYARNLFQKNNCFINEDIFVVTLFVFGLILLVESPVRMPWFLIFLAYLTAERFGVIENETSA